MSMPDELSKYIHDFLRGPTKSGESRRYEARQQWLKRHAYLGFQVGQVFKFGYEIDCCIGNTAIQTDILYTVIKTGKMITFQGSDGTLLRRKPKFIKAHTGYDYDDDRGYLVSDDWIVAFDKDKNLSFQNDIYSPIPGVSPLSRTVKRIPKKAPVPEPESDDE